MRGHVFVGALVGGVALVAATARDSHACGGCFVRPTSQSGTVVTDHRMIFSVSPTQTTLYDQIQYSGSPSDFGWVLPIHGQVGLGVSSDLVFSVLDRQTQTTILAPPYPCSPCTCGRGGAPLNASASNGSSGSSAGAGGITVIAQQVVGPYQTAQVHPQSTSDTGALAAWLQANGYEIPASVDPIIAAYVQEGFDFLAIKLVPGQGVQAMRPIAVTSTGAGLSLPLRMVAAGTGATVGITLWIVGSGRYEPQNFASFTIDPSTLVWDWSQSSSDYTTVRAQKEQAFANTAWQIESSLDMSPYVIENAVLQDPTAKDYAPLAPPDGGVGLSAIETRSQDLNTLFPMGGSSVRITRMRADLSQAALATDLVLQASADQSALSNQYQTKLSVNANCPTSCPCSSGGSGASSGGPFGGGVFGASGSISGSSGSTSPPKSGGSGAANASVSGGAQQSAPADAGTDNAASAPQSFGCSTSSSAPPGAGLFAALAGLAGLTLFRARRRRPRD